MRGKRDLTPPSSRCHWRGLTKGARRRLEVMRRLHQSHRYVWHARSIGALSSLGGYQPFAANGFTMNKNIPIGMLGFFAGVLAFFFLISIASAGYKFGKHLAQGHEHQSQPSTSASG